MKPHILASGEHAATHPGRYLESEAVLPTFPHAQTNRVLEISLSPMDDPVPKACRLERSIEGLAELCGFGQGRR